MISWQADVCTCLDACSRYPVLKATADTKNITSSKISTDLNAKYLPFITVSEKYSWRQKTLSNLRSNPSLHTHTHNTTQVEISTLPQSLETSREQWHRLPARCKPRWTPPRQKAFTGSIWYNKQQTQYRQACMSHSNHYPSDLVCTKRTQWDLFVQ